MDFVEGFISDCQARGLTKHTIETYTSQVESFLRAYNEPVKANIEELKQFLGELRNNGLTGSTLKGYFAAISTFYDYLVFEGITQFNPVPSFRKRYLSRIKEQYNGENCRQVISVPEMQHLIHAAEITGLLEYTLVLTLAKTGIRFGELYGLKVGDINMKTRTIILPPKAKRTNRAAFMDDELADAMSKYLAWREPLAKTSWLWISSRGGRIHKDEPNRIIAALAGPLNLHNPEGPLCGKLTCHCFRHWFTTHLYRAGMKEQYVKWLRGDSLSKEAWQGYNRIDPEIVRREYMQCIPKLLEAEFIQMHLGFQIGEQRTLIQYS